MEPGDDTYVTGYLMSKAAGIVGARRGAAFIVRREGNEVESLHLFRRFNIDEQDETTAIRQADALRQYVIPCLMNDDDSVIEIPGSQDAGGKSFVLVFLARDDTGVRGVAVMVVDCHSQAEAHRRLLALQRVMHE